MKINETGTSRQAWEQLDAHFRLQARVVRRFEHAGAAAVRRMWMTGKNELGEPLSAFEREALVERHCALFGNWPT